MTVVMGPAAVNEHTFTSWSTRLKVSGLIFDTIARTVAMPQSKIIKAQQLVVHAAHTGSLTRGEYRSLLGLIRHVATCVRPARVFLQRLREGERSEHRVNRISVSSAMREDLRWWRQILTSPMLNGVPLEYFRADPPPTSR
jgi:hypothetical protein